MISDFVANDRLSEHDRSSAMEDRSIDGQTIHEAASTGEARMSDHPRMSDPASDNADASSTTDARRKYDVLQIYYPKSKQLKLRDIIAQKEISFQEYMRRLFDDIIAKSEA